MNTAKLPASVVISLGVHGGALLAFAMMMHAAPKQAAQVVTGVELLTQAPKARPATAAVKPPPLSTMDFLKLALPTKAHVAAPEALAIKISEHKINLADAPKLQDKAMKALPKLAALDLGAHPEEMAKLDVKIDAHQAVRTLAALPRLEDVGRTRIKNLPQAIALEDQRREAVAAVGLEATIKPTSRHQALAAVAALQEAAPPEQDKRLGSMLPDRPILMEAHPQAAMMPRFEKVAAAPKIERRQAAAQADAQKKGVQIEGPLADRKVAAYAVPAFPDWARSQGILGADVGIRFTVDEDGNVLSDMQVVSSSGYGRMDKLAMESLKSWRFAPKAGAGVEWGVITFKFVLE